MHRLLAETGALYEEQPRLSESAAHHLKVIRPKEGETVELFDGKGRWRVYAFRGGVLTAAGSVAEDSREGRPELVLFACVTKGSRWDWTIEKATELGASRIVPVISERTIVRIAHDDMDQKRGRWLRIAEEAARQSDAKWVPDLVRPTGFAESVEMAAKCDTYVGALATPPPADMLSALESRRANRRGGSLAVFVGPEGDFTSDELAFLVSVATPVSFGSSVLRAETAAIYGLAVLKAWVDAHEV